MTGKSLTQMLLKTSLATIKDKEIVGKILLREYNDPKPKTSKDEVAQLALHFRVPNIDNYLKHISITNTY